MSDIYVGILIMAAFAAVVFFAALRLTRSAPRSLCDLLALATVLCIVLYIRDLWDNMLLAKLLPYSNLIVVGNWFPLAVGFLAGLVFRRLPGRIWRKSLSMVSLFAIGVYSIARPLMGAPPRCGDRWQDQVSLQTTNATCSAACAATLLRAHGISANEREMAELCLTRKGTYWQGLYRGLKLKTAQTPWAVEVFAGSVEELDEMLGSPAILIVRLDADASVSQHYIEEWGWIPGVSHSTVFFGFLGDNMVRMGDPAFGREEWTRHDLQLLWQGQGLRLVRRADWD